MSSTSRSCQSERPALTIKAIRERHAQSDTASVASLSEFSACDHLELTDYSSSDDNSPSSPYSGTSQHAESTSPTRWLRSASESTSKRSVDRVRRTTSAASIKQVEQPTSDPVDRYQVVSEIRKSLFGTVLLARDTVTSSDVAIKLSNTDLAMAGVSLTGCCVMENPVSEAALLQQLPAHPFIVSLQREHLVDNVHWSVMEYMPNGDLFEYLQTGSISARTARRYVRQIAQALLHVHAHKVCHLDVSLENILVDDKLNVKLTDFGVARSFDKQGTSTFPGVSEAAKPGKVRYMAPEMLAGQAFDGCLVDSFAVGVIMFCLLVGSAPFERAHRKDPRWQLIAAGDFQALFDLIGVTGPAASAVDLLKGLLTTADQRLSIAAVLKHAWFSEQLN